MLERSRAQGLVGPSQRKVSEEGEVLEQDFEGSVGVVWVDKIFMEGKIQYCANTYKIAFCSVFLLATISFSWQYRPH